MSIDRVKKSYLVRTSLFAFAIVVLVLGWSITPAQANPADADGCHTHKKDCDGGGGGDGGGTIPVMVTFRDFLGDADFSPDRLMSDCHLEPWRDCPYIDKMDKVSVGIGSSVGLEGQLAMHLGVRGKQPAIRQLFLDFSDDTDATGNPDGEPDNCVSGKGTCQPPTLPDGLTHGGVNLYTSGVNLKDVVDDGTSRPLNMSVGMDLNIINQGIWRLFFYYTSFADCPGGTTIGVTRTSADTWEIEAGTYAVACLAQQVGAQGYIFKGLYSMPFLMYVQKK